MVRRMRKNRIFIPLISLFFFSSIYAQDLIVIEKDYIPYPDSILVYTPDDYNENTDYPLVILLHGWSATYRQWSKDSDLQGTADKYGWVIACPDGFYDSWYVNNPMKPDVQFEKFFWDDFIPGLFGDYSIDKENIFISGLSMGGHGAVTLFLKNPNFFKAAGSTSGVMDLTHFPDRFSIKDGIGSIKDYPDAWLNNSAYHLLENIKGTDKPIIIDCGVDDFTYEINTKFYEKCKELGLNVKFISQPGNHRHKYWQKSILDHYEFFDRLIKKKP